MALSEEQAFKDVVDEIHEKVMADLATYPNITNISVDISLVYTRKPGTTSAQVTVKAAESRTNHYRQSVAVITTTS